VKARVLWGAVAVLMAVGMSSAAPTDDAKAALTRRIAMLRNITITADFRHIPCRGITQTNTQICVPTWFGDERLQKFSFLDGRVRYESREKPESTGLALSDTCAVIRREDMPSSVVEIRVDNLFERLVGYNNDTLMKGTMGKGAASGEEETIDGPLGLRAGGQWVTSEKLDTCKTAEGLRGIVTLEFARTNGVVESWSLSPDYGYAPVIQQIVRDDGTLQSRTVMSDWHKVGEVWVAHKAVKVEFYKGRFGKQYESNEYTFAVKTCQIGSKENVPSLYEMKWPDDATVTITDFDGKRHEARGKDIRRVKQPADANTGPTRKRWE
jgi:hypothetical protein